MQVLRDQGSITDLADPDLRALIEQRVSALDEFNDFDLNELVTFVIVQPGDSLEALDAQLGFPALSNRFELLEEHAGYYEIVFVLSDDGYGAEVFIPKHPDVDPQLLAMCATYAIPAQEQSDS